MVGLRLGELALRLGHLRCGGVDVGARGIHGRLSRSCGGDRLIVLLVRNLLFIDQLLIAAEVILRFDVIRVRLLQVCFGSFPLLPCSFDARLCVHHVCIRRGRLAFGVDGNHRHVDRGRIRVGFGVIEIGLRPFTATR